MRPSDQLLQTLDVTKDQPAATSQPDLTWEKQASAEFEKLQKNIPDILADTDLVALGSHGMVVAHKDNTVSKIFLRNEDQPWAEKLYRDEVRTLRRLNGAYFGSAHTPSIISQTAISNNPYAFASYRMTKFSGREIKWDDFVETADHQDVERHFHNVGEVLAHFHRDADFMIGDITPLPKSIGFATTIDPISGASERINRALSICNDHFQSHIEGGVSHNDFHSYNFKVDDEYRITGLFDLSFAGKTKNRLVDFCFIPDAGMPFAIAGYKEGGGKPVDPTMIILSRISQDVARINWHKHTAMGSLEIAHEQLEKLPERLNKITHLTGISFDQNESATSIKLNAQPRLKFP